MNENNNLDFKFAILIFQTIVFSGLLIFVLVLKMAFGDFYRAVREEYIKYFEQETDVEDILKPNAGIDSFDEDYTVYIE